MTKLDIEKIKRIHPNFKSTKINNGPYVLSGFNGKIHYSIYSWKAYTKSEFPYLEDEGFELFDKHFGFRTKEYIQVLAKSSEGFIAHFLGNKTFEVEIEFKGILYNSLIKYNSNDYIADLYKRIEIGGIEIEEDLWSISISKLNKDQINLTENDIFDIFESLFFELETNFTQGYFKLIEFPYLVGTKNPELTTMKIIEVPKRLTFTYKKYNRDLLDFYRIANEVKFTPFKYLSYYHILEYFSEKLLIDNMKEKLAGSYFEIDFKQNIDQYLLDNIRFIRKIHSSGQKNLTNVLQKFGKLEKVVEELKLKNLIEYFSKDLIIDTDQNFSFSGINFKSNRIASTLSNRIYEIRNSIVHSNSETIKEGNFLFKATDKNIGKLNKDLKLIKLITINVILSNQNNGLQQSTTDHTR